MTKSCQKDFPRDNPLLALCRASRILVMSMVMSIILTTAYFSSLNGKLSMKIANMQSRLTHSPAMVGLPLARRGCLSSQKCLSCRHIVGIKPVVPRRAHERKYSMVIANQASPNGKVRTVGKDFDCSMTDAAKPILDI